MNKFIILLSLILTGCNAGSTTPSQQNTSDIEPVIIPVNPITIYPPMKPVYPVIESIAPPIESVVVYPPMESLIFYPPIESLVPPMESLTIRNTYFKPYYPAGCIVNNKESGIVGTCECIQDPKTGEVWLATTNQTPAKWAEMSAWANNLNELSTCGLRNGWGLPDYNQLSKLSNYTSGLSDGQRSVWLNSNGFYNFDDNMYFGTMFGYPYSYSIFIKNGLVSNALDTEKVGVKGIAVNKGV